ncbi:MAG: mechanosensitive ion channel [Balneolaceae bacterium]|nr:mechanosensitive ion channel [Balneolaceae bacterium]
MNELQDKIAEFMATSPAITYQVLETIGVIFILWLLRFVAVRIVQKKIKDSKLLYKWRKNLTYITTIVGILVLGQVWFTAIDSLGTFLGLVSAGLAIALKDPVSDLAGWLLIIWRKPFDIGDRVQIGSSKGDVIDIRVFKFTILEIGNWVDADQSTGRVIHVPNHKVFVEDLANYTSDFEFIWNEIQVLITFESDWKKAKQILQEVVDEKVQGFIENAREQVKRAEKSYLIQYRYLTPIVYTNVQDSGISLTVRYLSDPRKRRSTEQVLWEGILERFSGQDDIDFAYPTIRYYDNSTEGKAGTIPGKSKNG